MDPVRFPEALASFFRRIGVEPGQVATPLSLEDFGRIAAEHDLILRPPDTGKWISGTAL